MKETLVRIDISKIKDPSFVKALGPKSLAILCHDIRQEIIKEVAAYGGHLSSNLGAVELTVSLYRVFNPPFDQIIFDVGHQCYTQKILSGRSLAHLGEKTAGSPFQCRPESPYDVYEAGHSSTSISAATAFALARDVRKDKNEVIAVIGDASMASGLAFEGLNNLAASGTKVIVILNDNDMSISSPAGALGRFFRKISSQKGYNRAKKNYQRIMNRTAIGRWFYGLSYRMKNSLKRTLVPTTLFDNLGFTYIGPVNGHSVKELDKALSRAKNTTKPTIVHVYTKKGKGYEKAENDKTGLYHGVAPFDPRQGIKLSENIANWPSFMGSLAEELLAKDEDVRLICPAMIQGSGLYDCFRKYPKRCHDVGIAEEHAATFTGALALNGFKPILAIYSTFLQRAYDEISHDIARFKCDATIFVDRAGPVGKDGATHQGLYDVSYLSSVPGAHVAMPSTPQEARALAEMSVLEKGHGLVAIRYPKDPLSGNLKGKADIRFGRFVFEGQGESLYIGVGPRGRELYKSLEANKNIAFCNPLFLNDFHPNDISRLLLYPKIFVYDSYSDEDGFLKNLESALFKAGYKGQLKAVSFPHEFIHHDLLEPQLRENHVDLDFAKQELLQFLG